MDLSTQSLRSLAAAPASMWSPLRKKRIYFGHQSVGRNILDGVRAVLTDHPQIPLSIHETTDPIEIAPAVLGHSLIGQNGDPVGKADHFSSLIREGIGDSVDIAMMKFCYVDFDLQTDYRSVFEEYRRRMADVRAAYPDLRIVHLTVPLTSPQTGPRAWFKRLVGRPVRGYEDNRVRAGYNDLLRREYGGKEPIFDLAALESMGLDQEALTVRLRRERHPVLVPEYTDDGGHLNALGRSVVAEQLLLFLADETGG